MQKPPILRAGTGRGESEYYLIQAPESPQWGVVVGTSGRGPSH